MVVRTRPGVGPKVKQGQAKNGDLAQAIAPLFTPAALMASTLGAWRLAADLEWVGEFAISRGLFSHWQVWIAAAAGLQLASRKLSRYGQEKTQANNKTPKS